jgi:hypothetical protein|eukprot:560256-Prymnesium_polylepis.2
MLFDDPPACLPHLRARGRSGKLARWRARRNNQIDTRTCTHVWNFVVGNSTAKQRNAQLNGESLRLGEAPFAAPFAET